MSSFIAFLLHWFLAPGHILITTNLRLNRSFFILYISFIAESQLAGDL